MRVQLLGSTIVALAAVSVGFGGTLTGTTSLPLATANAPTNSTPEASIKPEDAARLAKQASFGPTPELIDAITASKSIAAWLDHQFTLSISTYDDISTKVVTSDRCANLTGADLTNCNRENFSETPLQLRFYKNAIENEDQLRQRVSFALSQIIVASSQEVRNTSGIATFNQILLSNSFGNYRDIIKEVTLNPFMGSYLDMLDSNKAQPNENYARELMQLFSTGTVLLNPDGTVQLDSTGATIPTYSNTDVKEVARALTGWTWARTDGSLSDYNTRNWSKPMVMNAARFDTGTKTFLGKTVAAGASQQANVDAVVDAVFNHPNTGPYVCKRLIQQLTVANPTPAYVGRVSAAFADNGSGVRGDMKAVVRAIYLDKEARTVSQLPGKVKEPVLLATSLARAIGYKTDGYAFITRDVGMGQAPFRAPSVFNYYPYDFPLPQGAGLISPVSKLMTTSTSIARHNLTYDWTVSGEASRPEFQPTLGTGTAPNWASWEANGENDAKTIDRINLVMLNGTMTAAQREALMTTMTTIRHTDLAVQARRRAQAALYIVASSPLFQVDR